MNYETPKVNPQEDYHKTKGYQPGELIKGYIDDSTTKVFKPENRINFMTDGLFGHCNDRRFLTFMNNIESQCSFKKQAMTQSFCEKDLSI